MPKCTRRKPLRDLLRGQSLIEVVVAIALLAILASSLFIFSWSQLSVSNQSSRSSEALAAAQEGIDAVRAIRDEGWSNVTTGTHGLAYSNNQWDFQGASDTSTGHTRTVTVTDVSPTEKQAVVTVEWEDDTQKTQTTTLATVLTDWQNASSTPPPRLSGNWKNPQTLGSVDLGPGVEATGVAVHNKLVYMTGTASTASKPDFFVINALDGTHPSVAANLNIGPGSNDVSVLGNFAYVANNDTSNQLSIINISATTSPSNIRNFTLTGNNDVARSVAATGTLVLIGTANDSGNELYLVDVSNPSLPLIKSKLEIGADVNRVFILGNYAYLATASTTGEFVTIDISNPNAPVLKARVSLPGSNVATGLYVNYQDHRAYITRHQASGVSPEINIYDVTNPDSPVLLGSKEFNGDLPAVFAADNLLFVGTGVSNLEFQIFDATDPQNLIYYSGLNFPEEAADITFENNIIYAAVRSNDALRIITSQ